MKLSVLILFLFVALEGKTQNIFPKKLDNCVTTRFCLDCGDVLANYETKPFKALIDKLNKINDFEGIAGKVKFQVLVDSSSSACVLSHTSSSSDHPITKSIIDNLNAFKAWIPAQIDGKKEECTSIILVFNILEGKLSAKIERIDIPKFEESFFGEQDPEIYNKEYTYKNENLKNYKITVWNNKNSDLPDNFSDNISIDKKDVVWYETDNQLVCFKDDIFTKFGASNSPFKEAVSIKAIATDNENTKWVYSAVDGIYSYKEDKWLKHDEEDIGIDGCYQIINNPKTGELFFCADEGLLIHKGGEWFMLNQSNLKELPAQKVYFAKRDSKNRLWIGTFKGSLMLDKDQTVTVFNNTNSPLKGKCIADLEEDSKGNLYFGVYEFGNKNGEVNRAEGIVIQHVDATWEHLTTANSGIPYNHTTGLVLDKEEAVLWISTDRAGLVRFDIKNKTWENYHNQNSAIPTSYISAIAQDSKNNIYLSTRNGMVKIEKLK
jgi:hypothetical protein